MSVRTPELPEPFTTETYEDGGWFKWFILLLILGAIIVFSISYASTTTQGWEAAEVRECMGNKPTFTAMINPTQFMRFCEVEEDIIGVQLLERDEKGNYREVYARMEYRFRSMEDVLEFINKNKFRLLDQLR